MSAIYDNWERLVAAAVKKQQLWELFHAQSRSPSTLSEASDISSSFNSNSYLNDPALDFSIPAHKIPTEKLTVASEVEEHHPAVVKKTAIEVQREITEAWKKFVADRKKTNGVC